MDFKMIWFFAAVCFVQVSSSKLPSVQEEKGFDSIDNFTKVDNFGELITMGVMEPTLIEPTWKTARCYEKLMHDYSEFVKEFNDKMNDALDRVSKTLLNKHRKNGRIAEKSIREIMRLMKKYPSEMKKLLDAKKYPSALELLKTTRTKVEYYDYKFGRLIVNVKKDSAEHSRKAEEKYRVARDFGKKRGGELSERYHMCYIPRGDE